MVENQRIKGCFDRKIRRFICLEILESLKSNFFGYCVRIKVVKVISTTLICSIAIEQIKVVEITFLQINSVKAMLKMLHVKTFRKCKSLAIFCLRFVCNA